jgi:hypothetical protein
MLCESMVRTKRHLLFPERRYPDCTASTFHRSVHVRDCWDMDAEYITTGELLLQYFSAIEELEGEDRTLKTALKTECELELPLALLRLDGRQPSEHTQTGGDSL